MDLEEQCENYLKYIKHNTKKTQKECENCNSEYYINSYNNYCKNCGKKDEVFIINKYFV